MSVRVETTVHIERSPEDVFTFIATPENLPRWDPGIREVRRLDDGPVRQGSGLAVTAEEGGRRVQLDTRVTEYEPARLFGVAGTFGGVPLRLRWRLVPDGSGTSLTSEGEAEVGGFMALASGFVRGLVQARLESAHVNLKRLLESERV